MILLSWGKTPSAPPGVVLLFGSGLIGDAIATALLLAGAGAVAQRFDWTWQGPSAVEVRAVEMAAKQALAVRDGAQFATIWAAGLSGFGSSKEAMKSEFTALEGVIQTTRRVGAGLAPGKRAFVHVSSAGGLFEGQVACGPDAAPLPLRAYGHGKLAQEQHIMADKTLGKRLILRPSSVYGYSSGARRGLLSTLLVNAIQQRVVTISGSLTTLRDYVFAPDVGRFVAGRLLDSRSDGSASSTEICLLASARPASVFEILRLVEGYLGRALHVRVDTRPDNMRNNTFLPSAVAAGFRPTALQEGLVSTAGAVTRERFMGAVL